MILKQLKKSAKFSSNLLSCSNVFLGLFTEVSKKRNGYFCWINVILLQIF